MPQACRITANAGHIRLTMLRDPRADAGYIIMRQAEYPPMSGSNAICVVTALLETAIVPVIEPVTELALEAPGGVIRVGARSGGQVRRPGQEARSGGQFRAENLRRARLARFGQAGHVARQCIYLKVDPVADCRSAPGGCVFGVGDEIDAEIAPLYVIHR